MRRARDVQRLGPIHLLTISAARSRMRLGAKIHQLLYRIQAIAQGRRKKRSA
jgi:hypothetical protein